MKTKIYSYYFDTHNADENAAYNELCTRLRKTNGKCFETHGGNSHYNAAWKDGVDVELDTSFLVDNQWNADVGRVFDWAQDSRYVFSSHSPYIKRGHYLVITDEMREIRRNTLKCRYCGKMEPAQKGYVFCPHCRANEYLKEKDLFLTRMMRVDDKSDCPPLTDAEKAYLLPLWQADQLTGNSERGKARMAKAREGVASRYAKVVKEAEEERTLATWCLDNGFLPDVAIWYSHTQRAGFGWSKPVDADTLSKLLDVISEAPFAYDIKCADGRTLSGN